MAGSSTTPRVRTESVTEHVPVYGPKITEVSGQPVFEYGLSRSHGGPHASLDSALDAVREMSKVRMRRSNGDDVPTMEFYGQYGLFRETKGIEADGDEHAAGIYIRGLGSPTSRIRHITSLDDPTAIAAIDIETTKRVSVHLDAFGPAASAEDRGAVQSALDSIREH